jgi:CPA1 family monovalent cation:H+ antiporter
MHQAEIVAILLMMMAALVVIAKKLGSPFPVMLVLGGLAVSFIPGLPEVKLDPNLVFFFFLPALLYPTALFTSWRDFRRNLRSILLLAIGLVLITMVAVAWVAHTLIPSLPWAAAFALGAIVSPPDAIAATAVVQRLSIPHRIKAVLESESLVNDATALVALQFAVGAMMTGNFSLPQASLRFVLVGAGGIGFGLLVGFLMRAVQRRLDDPPVQVTVSLLTSLLAYLPAERLHVSGVLATVTAGMYLGWHSPLIVRARYRLQAFAVWEIVGFLVNGFIFIIIGLQLPGILRAIKGESFGTLIYDALLICGAVVVARIAWVIPGVYLPRLLSKKIRTREPKPRWQNVALVCWAGMRGVISLAAAFALPFTLPNGSPFPGRNYILFFTFCVILATLVGQGLTLPFLIRKLGIKDDGATDEEERAARLAANEAAIAFLENECLRDGASPEVFRRLRAEYDDRIAQLRRCSMENGNRSGSVATPQYQQLQQQALSTERDTIIKLRNKHVINDEALRRIQRDLDLAEVRLFGE